MPNLKLFLHINKLLTTLHEEDNSKMTALALLVARLVLWSLRTLVDDCPVVSMGEPVAEHRSAL